MELSPRKKIILRAVVDDYIKNAEPVGSKALVEGGELKLSSATLRNEMAALEDMGYLEQPHTSAGRVPTSMGYRKYVDELMSERKLTERERQFIDKQLTPRARELDNLIAEAGKLVSTLTRYTAYAYVPQIEMRKLLRFDLFMADSMSFVIVVVCDGGGVRNKVVRSSIPPVDAALKQLTAALNTVFSGLTPLEITPAQEQDVLHLSGSGAVYYPHVIAFLREGGTPRVHLSGEHRLLEHPEYRDIDRAKRLLEYVSDKEELARLPAPEQDVHFLIGPENVADELRDASVIIASYPVGDNLRGLIGLVGPTRMDYGALSSRMSYLASRLGELFKLPEQTPNTPDEKEEP
jgi:heat-inducible transcriptional repressor